MVGRQRRASLGGADLGVAAALAIAIVAAFLLDEAPLSDGGRTWVGVLIALVPPAAWIVLFYRRDRSEPEPRHYVLAVAVLGGLIATAVGEPLIEAMDIETAFGSSLPTRLLSAVVIVGVIREVATYAAIRFSIFSSPEFGGTMDGLVYGTAAGLGYATAVNLGFVIEASGAELGVATLRISVFSLAYAALGGLIGVALAQYRYGGRPAWWPAAAVAAAALLGGIFFVLRSELTSGVGSGLTGAGQWISLAVAAALAVALTIGLIAVSTAPEGRATVVET